MIELRVYTKARASQIVLSQEIARGYARFLPGLVVTLASGRTFTFLGFCLFFLRYSYSYRDWD